MNFLTVMFLGRSGCGKGTQAELLMNDLKAASATPIFYLETGKKFRDFIAGNNYSNLLSRQLMETGELQPSFLAVWNWAHLFVENLVAETHLVLDGTPRKLDEAKILDGALKFYNRTKPVVIHIKVSDIWSRERLLARGRADDKTLDNINKRLAWFETDVVPTLDYFRTNPDYRFIEVNGEQTINQVYQELKTALASHD